jgi:transcriptional regulator with XRE-family HTH domain
MPRRKIDPVMSERMRVWLREAVDRLVSTEGSQKAAAAKLGMNQTYLSKLLNGAAPVTYSTVMNVSTRTGISPEFYTQDNGPDEVEQPLGKGTPEPRVRAAKPDSPKELARQVLRAYADADAKTFEAVALRLALKIDDAARPVEAVTCALIVGLLWKIRER